MSRQEKKYHFIYKTTDKRNGNFYIGMHSTNNLNDGYIGSGTRLKHLIYKHGKEIFNFEILEFLPNRTLLKIREMEIITSDLLIESKCMNLKPGGYGGFNNKEHQLKCSQAAGKKHSYRMKNDEEYRKNISEKLSKSNKRRYENGDLKLFLEQGKNGFKGKKHSEESKNKISDNKKNKYTGSENSQFNTCWITKSQVNKKIKKDEFNLYEKDGWTIGRYQPYRGELSGSNKLKEVDVIEIKKLISENNLTTEKISKRFNVARQTIDKIKRGLTWSHIK